MRITSREPNLKQRLMARVKPIKNIKKCWEWNGYKNNKGYGCLQYGMRFYFAHRASYIAFVGQIPDGLTIDHLCKNKSCINPFHLEPVTNAENMRRAKRLSCKRGHPLSGDNINTYDNRRNCRTCNKERSRLWREKCV